MIRTNNRRMCLIANYLKQIKYIIKNKSQSLAAKLQINEEFTF